MTQETHREASRKNGQPTYVFVHGAGSNSFSWAPLLRELALLGHRTLAVDLPGHGFDAQFPISYQAPQDLEAFATEPSAMARITLQDNVNHVVDIVRRVAVHGPVILVGASMGGVIISGVGNAIPELLHRIVYISAWCCVDLPSIAEYSQTRENNESLLPSLAGVAVGNPTQIGVGRTNYRSADPAFLSNAKAALMADATDDQFRAFLNTLQPDESLAVMVADARVDAKTWGRIPHTYIRLTRDRSIPPSMQDRMIAEADALTPHNKFDVRTVEASHVGFVLKAREVAGILASLA
ncbi:alpha/beta hydrolase [Archangium violaceum]|uniref:alpha/beta hydrolase n=1 Tax=Archangium violaceum TaxID=83451 RepID=UPI00193C44F9|nr:alpha/beta fold hydrolase [Archangium violaceum]QRK04216.1 alpha/beta hydrolase [Archangium violaceum]